MVSEFSELIVDSFAGGGGTSEGIRAALGRDPDIAINHDAFALAMHRVNHPNTKHMVEDVWNVDARHMCGGRPIGLLWLSPDCKHFSKAKGGKPRNKDIRGLAWVALSWVKSLPKMQRPRIIILENVEEFQDWGPLLDDGTPCPVQKGATFNSYISGFGSLGYVAEWRELRACDYGDPTIRKRLFVIMRRDKRPIVWPERTHGNPKDAKDAAQIAAGKLKPWRTAAEIIDFTLPCPSIFETSNEIKEKHGLRANRPLADNTMSRVAKGTMRYVVNAARPFIVPVTHSGDDRCHSIDEPIRTQTGAHRGEHALLMPFVTKFNRGATGQPLDEPLATVTAHASESHGGGAAPLGMVAPLLVRTAHGERDRSGKKRGQGEHPVDEPLPTVTASNDAAVVAPILIGCGGRAGQSEPRPADEPVLTQTSKADACIVAPFLVPRYGERPGQEPRTRAVDEPAAVIVPTANEGSLAAVHLSRQFGASIGSAVDEPAPTVTAGGDGKTAVIAAHLSAYYGEGTGSQDRSAAMDEPVRTVTVENRHALIAAHLSTMRNSDKPFSSADEPMQTVTAGGANAAVVAAFLAQHNTDRGEGIKAGRPIDEPISTVTASGGQNTVVAAFMAQHNTDMVGHEMSEPVSTIVDKGCTQGYVAAHMINLRGSDRRDAAADEPLQTVSAQGNHAGLVAAFLAKYYGAGEPSQAVDDPLHTVTAKPRHGLVTVSIDGESFVITDIGMRMLTPRERFSAQGFRTDYTIDHGITETGEIVKFTLEQQGRMCGNSVCPGMSRSLVGANYDPSEALPIRRRTGATPLLEAAE